MKRMVSVILIVLSIIIIPPTEAQAGPSIEESPVVEEVTPEPYGPMPYDIVIEIEEKYPVARQVWDALKSAGYSDYVCAGIMGNIMAEVGGQTLDLQWEHWSRDSSYGICQWTQGRKKTLLNDFGADLEAQINFLLWDMEYEFNTYGKRYKKGFNYEDFCALTDYKEISLAFAKCYERCASGSYNVRKRNAEKAYNYFVKGSI